MQDLHPDGVDAAADRLWRRLHPMLPSSWRDMEPIGRSEFGGAVEQAISVHLEVTAQHRGSDSPLSTPIEPWIAADLTL